MLLLAKLILERVPFLFESLLEQEEIFVLLVFEVFRTLITLVFGLNEEFL